jgi:hypothetical protein
VGLRRSKAWANNQYVYFAIEFSEPFAEYAIYNTTKAENSMSVGDLMQWMLSSFKTVDEIIANLKNVIVVNVDNKEFGGAALPFHFKIVDPSGDSKIIEIVNNGEVKIYDPYIGVITNSPTYDWHLINQRNYLNLSSNPNSPMNFDEYKLKPLNYTDVISTNYDPSESVYFGCQFITMNFQINDDNMKNYLSNYEQNNLLWLLVFANCPTYNKTQAPINKNKSLCR